MNLGAVIVAAGLSSRMGQLKALKEVMGQPVILHMIHKLKAVGVKKIVIVTGHCHEKLETLLQRDATIETVYNAQYAQSDMFASAKLGMQQLQGRCDKFFFMPVDAPAFSIETLHLLLQQEGKIIKPIYKGRGGHPLLIVEKLIPALTSYRGNEGMRGALSPYQTVTVEQMTMDEGILFNTNTPEEFDKMRLYVENRAYT